MFIVQSVLSLLSFVMVGSAYAIIDMHPCLRKYKSISLLQSFSLAGPDVNPNA